ncbi:MAG: hypothetical protein ACQESR_18205 [Planctomycetota bacterium]
MPVARWFGIFQAVKFFRVERYPTQAVLPLVAHAKHAGTVRASYSPRL